MFILGKLVFQNYIPAELTVGMMFKQRIKDVIYGKIYEYDRIFILNHKPQDKESYILTNGFPVAPHIYTITANPDDNAELLATPDMISWWDEGSHSDELRDVELGDFNFILQEEDGVLEIEIADHMFEEGIAEPTLYMGKCTIRIVTDDDEDEDYDDYEDWDDMDDETDYDPQDYETE